MPLADSVTLQNASFPGSVTVGDLKGANTLIINNVHVAATLNVRNGPTKETTTIAGVTVGKNLIILDGNGGQKVSLQAVQVAGKTSISSTGKGADVLTIDDSTFHGAVALITANGNDLVQIDANGDPLGPPTSFESSVVVTLSGGNDVLQLGVAGQTGNHSDFAGSVHFMGGSGFDTLQNSLPLPSTATLGSPSRTLNPPPVPPTPPPTVSFTSPGDTTTGVALNKKIAVDLQRAHGAP